MNEENLREVLETILDELSGTNFIWGLGGSANLKIQGIDVSVKDLDITTTDEGIKIFRKCLSQYIVKDSLNEKTNGPQLMCDINGIEVEINSYGDRELVMFDKTQKTIWEGLELTVLPLRYAREFYRMIGRSEKVEIISKYL
jgi:hypothetical protein